MNVVMKNAQINGFQFGLLDETQNQTKEIKRWKQNKKGMNMVLDDMKNRVDLLSQNAKTKQSQSSAFNMKSSIIGTVEAVNGMMASVVMSVELPPNAVTSTY